MPNAPAADAGVDATNGNDAQPSFSDARPNDSAPACQENERRDVPCGDGGFQHQVCHDSRWVDQGDCVVRAACLQEGRQRLGPCDWDPLALQPERCDGGRWQPYLGCLRSWQWEGSPQDIGRSLAVDSQGNVLVAGFTSGHFDGTTSAGQVDAFLLALSPDGHERWIRQWGSDLNDAASSVAVDGDDNIYVAGYTEGTLTASQPGHGQSDAFVSKFDPTGKLLWTRQFGSSEMDGAIGIASGPHGTMLVTGYTYGTLLGHPPAGKQDAFVMALDASGNVAWSTLWGTNQDDSGTSIGLDPWGNVLLLAYSLGVPPGAHAHGNLDYALVEMTDHGEVVSAQLYGSKADDTALSLFVDEPSDSVWIAGFTYGDMLLQTNHGELDAFVSNVRLGQDGTQTPQRVWEFGTDNFDMGRAVAVTSDGQVFSCGDTYAGLGGGTNAGEFDLFVARHGPDGLRTMLLGSSGTDQCHAMAVSGQTLWLTGHAGGHLPTSPKGQYGSVMVTRIETR